MFFCKSAAENGGDSPVVFNRDMIKDINKELVEKIKRRKIRYVRNLNHEDNSTYLTWQETFKSKDKKASLFNFMLVCKRNTYVSRDKFRKSVNSLCESDLNS